MRDADYRALERRWHVSKDLKDEAAYLKAALRLGRITKLQLEVASECFDEAAQLTMGFSPWRMDPFVESKKRFRNWVEGLTIIHGAWWNQHQICTRIGIACAAACLPIIDSDDKSMEEYQLQQARESLSWEIPLPVHSEKWQTLAGQFEIASMLDQENNGMISRCALAIAMQDDKERGRTVWIAADEASKILSRHKGKRRRDRVDFINMAAIISQALIAWTREKL